MLTEKYSGSFLELYDVENNKGQTIKNIIETEKETNVELLKWDENQIAAYLKKFGAISPQGLNKSMVVLRKFANFICTKEKLGKREYVVDDGVFLQLIDKQQLMSVTLNYNQYTSIKNQLDIKDGGMKVNVRDKLIFELAWSGLTNDEIRSIREDKIEFVNSDNGWEIAILNLEDKIVRIEDSEIVEDIKLCLKETYCVREAKDGRIKKTFYRDSEYLIKPINVGRSSNKTWLDNPHLALQSVLRRSGITCEGIDITNLTLEDIRRSKLIYLLAPENQEFFDFATISGLFNLKTTNSLRWLRDVAKLKYPE